VQKVPRAGKMTAAFEERIAAFLHAHELLAGTARLLLAVSGGADSTAMLHCLASLRASGRITPELVCAHLNHGLRGDAADADQHFVAEHARRLGMEFRVARVDVRQHARASGLSIQTAGRNLRIARLLEIARQCGCQAIATAHQKDDNAETLIQRLSRGTGIRGLAGIGAKSLFAGGLAFVRPLLCVRRDQVLQYLRSRGLTWRNDATNAELKYRRNFIRHRLLPLLQAHSTTPLAELLFDLARAAEGYYDLVCRQADEVWPRCAACDGARVLLDLQMFSAHVEPVKVELLRRALAELGSGQGRLTRQHYQKMLYLAEHAPTGKTAVLPQGFTVRREYRKLVFERRPAQSPASAPLGDRAVELPIPGKTTFGAYSIRATLVRPGGPADLPLGPDPDGQTERFDLEKLTPPVVVRPRRPGDAFEPLGLKARKKIGKFLTDARVPRQLREKTLVVADRDKIIWLWPLRISELAKVTDRTRNVLLLQISAASGTPDGPRRPG